MGNDALHRSARNTLARLARARMDNDVFRWEAAEVLRRAIGFDTWCFVLLDPTTGLPTRYASTNPVIGQNQRRFFPLYLQSLAACPPPGRTRAAEVSVLSAATAGALDRDPVWREMLGPGGLGDQLGAHLTANGVCWAYLALYRDEGRAWFNAGDAAFVASDAVIKSFEVPASFLDELQATAVPESLARQFPTAPIISADVGITGQLDQFGLRQGQIQQLLNAIIQGTGKVGP
jgi:hypothetical protein